MSAPTIVRELLPPADQPDAHALAREVLLLVGGEEKADRAGDYAGYTRGPVLIDAVRQKTGRIAYHAAAWLIFDRKLMEAPPAPDETRPGKVDAYRLTPLGVEVYTLLLDRLDDRLRADANVDGGEDGEDATPAPTSTAAASPFADPPRRRSAGKPAAQPATKPTKPATARR